MVEYVSSPMVDANINSFFYSGKYFQPISVKVALLTMIQSFSGSRREGDSCSFRPSSKGPPMGMMALETLPVEELRSRTSFRVVFLTPLPLLVGIC